MRNGIVLLFIVLILVVPLEAKAMPNQALLQTASVIEETDVGIEQWEVTYKEKVTKQHGMKLLKKLRNTYNLTRKQNENSVVYTVEDSHNDAKMVEQYSIVIPKNGVGKIDVIAILKGSLWNKTIATDYLKWQSFVTEKMFTNNVRAYTCLTTTFSGIINRDIVQKYILQALEIEDVQTQVDHNEDTTLEKVIYGYTKLWAQKINIENVPMNFQMAVTTNELGEFQMIIGTPILINEY